MAQRAEAGPGGDREKRLLHRSETPGEAPDERVRPAHTNGRAAPLPWGWADLFPLPHDLSPAGTRR